MVNPRDVAGNTEEEEEDHTAAVQSHRMDMDSLSFLRVADEAKTDVTKTISFSAAISSDVNFYGQHFSSLCSLKTVHMSAEVNILISI